MKLSRSADLGNAVTTRQMAPPSEAACRTTNPLPHVSGKVIAMWMPILVFFYMAFEHSVVNMFLFPSALIMGGKFSIGDYFVWNEIPTLLGNLVGGISFTGLTLYRTHVRTAPKRKSASVSPPATMVAERA